MDHPSHLQSAHPALDGDASLIDLEDQEFQHILEHLLTEDEQDDNTVVDESVAPQPAEAFGTDPQLGVAQESDQPMQVEIPESSEAQLAPSAQNLPPPGPRQWYGLFSGWSQVAGDLSGDIPVDNNLGGGPDLPMDPLLFDSPASDPLPVVSPPINPIPVDPLLFDPIIPQPPPVDAFPVDQVPVDQFLFDQVPDIQFSVNPVSVDPYQGNQQFPAPMPFTQFPVNQTPVNQFPVNQFPVNQFPVNQFPVNQFPVNQFPVNQFPVNQFPVNQFSVNQFPVNQFSVNQLPVNQFSVDQSPMNQFPVDQFLIDPFQVNPPLPAPPPYNQFPIDQLSVDQIPIDPQLLDPQLPNAPPMNPFSVAPPPINPFSIGQFPADQFSVGQIPIDPQLLDPQLFNPPPMDPSPVGPMFVAPPQLSPLFNYHQPGTGFAQADQQGHASVDAANDQSVGALFPAGIDGALFADIEGLAHFDDAPNDQPVFNPGQSYPQQPQQQHALNIGESDALQPLPGLPDNTGFEGVQDMAPNWAPLNEDVPAVGEQNFWSQLEPPSTQLALPIPQPSGAMANPHAQNLPPGVPVYQEEGVENPGPLPADQPPQAGAVPGPYQEQGFVPQFTSLDAAMTHKHSHLANMQEVQDETFPRTEAENVAVIGRLYMAIINVEDTRDWTPELAAKGKTVPFAYRQFSAPRPSEFHPVHVEVACWDLLERMKRRQMSEGLVPIWQRRVKKVESHATFEDLLQSVIETLKRWKSICKRLLDVCYLDSLVDAPAASGSRVQQNKHLNLNKADKDTRLRKVEQDVMETAGAEGASRPENPVQATAGSSTQPLTPGPIAPQPTQAPFPPSMTASQTPQHGWSLLDEGTPHQPYVPSTVNPNMMYQPAPGTMPSAAHGTPAVPPARKRKAPNEGSTTVGAPGPSTGNPSGFSTNPGPSIGNSSGFSADEAAGTTKRRKL